MPSLASPTALPNASPSLASPPEPGSPPRSPHPEARLSESSTLMTNATMARLAVKWRRLDSATLVLPSAEKTLLQAARSPFPSASPAQRFTTPVASCAQRRAPPPPPRNGTCPSLTATCTSFATTVPSPFSNWAPTALPSLPARHSERPAVSRLALLSLSVGLPATVPRAAPAPRHSPPPEAEPLAAWSRLAESDVRSFAKQTSLPRVESPQ